MAAAPVACRLWSLLREWIVSTSLSISPGASRPDSSFAVRAHVYDADAIMGIQYGDGVVWPNCQPMGKWSGIAGKKRMQHKRRKREIIDPIDVARDFHLLQVVAVNFDQDFHPEAHGPSASETQ